MSNTERLLEAICDTDDGSGWWELFSSKQEAKKILAGAIKEDPDEGQIAMLLATIEPDSDSFEFYTYEQIYKKTLKELRQELNEG